MGGDSDVCRARDAGDGGLAKSQAGMCLSASPSLSAQGQGPISSRRFDLKVSVVRFDADAPQLHFEKHGPAVGASFHPVYGWQAPPNMVKLSLLVLLDGEATDMDEWELEVLGETWAYVTILLSKWYYQRENAADRAASSCLASYLAFIHTRTHLSCLPISCTLSLDRISHTQKVGRDGCPNHHRHANELERVARANPHIHFFDCQGRMAERLILHDVLQALYPAQPPSDEEILDPQFDHAPPPYKV